MTIALAIKVNEGLVLAADSATTLALGGIVNGDPNNALIYDNANKVMNLHRDLPIGMVTWGLGSVGIQSISSLAKDLRKRFMGSDAHWHLDPSTFSMVTVAQRVKQFFHDERLMPQQASVPASSTLGIFVGGISAGSSAAEAFVIETDGVTCPGPVPVLPGTSDAFWAGQPEAISRLLLGVSPQLGQALENLGVSSADVPKYVEAIKQQTNIPLLTPPMPIQDAIDLAAFLVDTTIKFTKFRPGYNTVGGPIEIAAITQHEGFKWVQRKHYYETTLNSGGVR